MAQLVGHFVEKLMRSTNFGCGRKKEHGGSSGIRPWQPGSIAEIKRLTHLAGFYIDSHGLFKETGIF